METNDITADAARAFQAFDDANSIEVLRGAWARRAAGFRAMYLELGEISATTDSLMATKLSDALRANITGHSVAHFRREIGMKAFERRARSVESIERPTPAELPFDPAARSEGVSVEVHVLARVLPALVMSAYSSESTLRVESVEALASIAATLTRHALQGLREAHS